MGDTRTQRQRDAELVAEGELCTTLAIASCGRDEVLTQDEVDRLLGVATR